MAKSSQLNDSSSAAAREKTFQLIVRYLRHNPAYLLVFAVGLIGTSLLGVNALSKQDPEQMKLEFWAFALLVLSALVVIGLVEYGRYHAPNQRRTGTEERERLSRFAALIKGEWWERIVSPVTAYVSHVTIQANPASGEVSLIARAYNDDGNLAVKWQSDAAVLRGNKLFYIWSGKYLDEKRSKEQRGGFGHFTFLGKDKLDFGEGDFMDIDISLQHPDTTAWKSAQFMRCTADDIADLNTHDVVRIGAAIRRIKKKTISAASSV